jgi:hypothetical protein
MPERCRMALRAHAARRPHAPGALHTAAQVCVLREAQPGALHTAAQVCVLREAQPGALHTAAPAGPSRSPALLTLKAPRFDAHGPTRGPAWHTAAPAARLHTSHAYPPPVAAEAAAGSTVSAHLMACSRQSTSTTWPHAAPRRAAGSRAARNLRPLHPVREPAGHGLGPAPGIVVRQGQREQGRPGRVGGRDDATQVQRRAASRPPLA